MTALYLFTHATCSPVLSTWGLSLAAGKAALWVTPTARPWRAPTNPRQHIPGSFENCRKARNVHIEGPHGAAIWTSRAGDGNCQRYELFPSRLLKNLSSGIASLRLDSASSDTGNTVLFHSGPHTRQDHRMVVLDLSADAERSYEGMYCQPDQAGASQQSCGSCR